MFKTKAFWTMFKKSADFVGYGTPKRLWTFVAWELVQSRDKLEIIELGQQNIRWQQSSFFMESHLSYFQILAIAKNLVCGEMLHEWSMYGAIISLFDTLHLFLLVVVVVTALYCHFHKSVE